MIFRGRLASVFVVEFIPFSHQSSNFVIDPWLFVFVFFFYILCGINLSMARSSSDVMLSHS